jgi:NADPH-dependent glutamate synthase beta subunit-like oxidoreductase/Pyruvate/2-oxoacid:ferredoxin oxidoreductase delta subunit
MVKITIDAKEVEAKEGQTVLQAADKAGIYIPRLCSHPDLVSLRQVKSVTVVFRGADRFEGESAKEYEGCKLCLVEVSGRAEPVTSCDTVVEAGMGVVTVSERLKRLRRENLTKILRDHPHACLTCAQTSGCPRTQCSANVPEVERCCQKLGNCELQRVAEFIGVPPDLPRYVPKNLPVVKDEPLLVRDYNLCIGCARCVRACGALRGIEALGFTFQNGQVVVGTVKEGLADSGCKFCGACVEVCPTGALTDKDITPADREKKLVPCKSGCPCGIDVPAYVRYIRDGDYKSAARVVLEKVPFLFTLGYVCFHPCEAVCRRGEVNEVISICALKRFAAENDGGDYENRASSAPTGKKVAIIGAGPAGLTAAYYLARKGHNVTVYDSGVEAGGMLRYGIPQYRLPKGALEKDLRRIARAGVSIKTGVKIDSLADVSGQFDAVLLSVGAQAAKRLMIEGVDLQSVYFGIELLRKKALGELRPDFFGGKRVLVIGGGNVALDCARTALRVGAEKVQVACLESEEDMPAHDWEIEDARAEGIGIHPCWGPTRIRGCDGKVVGVDFVCCISVFDSAGVFCPAFDRSKTKSLDCDAVIIAVGQVPDLSLISGSEITVGKYGTVEADSESGKTRTASVFAAGEG